MTSEYKLKDIISLDPDLISNLRIPLNVDGSDYEFRTFDVRSSIIELGDFFDYLQIKRAYGSVEEKLKNFTYGKSFSDFSDFEVYNIKKSTFKVDIEGAEYELEITGVGPVALKVSLVLIFSKIEKETNPLEKRIKQMILDKYSSLLKDENNLKKLNEIKKESDKREAEQEKIREEVRKEQEEKERKRKELEEMLNRNKPKNNDRPFKMYWLTYDVFNKIIDAAF